jgi:hypothetical protein
MWTVAAVRADGSVVVGDSERGDVVLPASYVGRHVELGWAVTGYGNQGWVCSSDLAPPMSPVLI